MKATTPACIGLLLLAVLALVFSERDQIGHFFSFTYPATAYAAASDTTAAKPCYRDVVLDTYGESACDLTDPFYNGSCPTCTVLVIPQALGRFLGDREGTKTLFIVAPKGTQFDNATAIKWDTDAIKLVSKRIFFKRFMLMKAKFNGAGLEKQEYRVLVGKCQGTVTWKSSGAQKCITSYCLDKAIACQSDTECSGWMSCMQECGDDSMLCPTVCGAYFQSAAINNFLQCGLDNGCIKIDFSSLPKCKLPEAPPVTVGNIDGFWWVSAIQGYDYVLYDDCQRFIFKELSPTQISVENSTTVTYNGNTRVVKNIGTYTRTSDGYLKLVYNNWAGYYEQYYPYHVSPNAMIMHVCSVDSSTIGHDYGTLILTRVPLSSLGSTEMAGLETSLQNIFHTSLADFRLIRTHDCPNAETSQMQAGGN